MIHRKIFFFLVIKTLPFRWYFVRLISETKLYLSNIHPCLGPGKLLSFFFFLMSSSGDTQSDTQWEKSDKYWTLKQRNSYKVAWNQESW